MEPITHYSHEHPLYLLKQKPMEEVKTCYACEVSLIQEDEHLVEVYGCELCEEFFLHKHCAELPMEIVHKVHENHSLFLVLKPPGDYKFNSCNCQLQCPLFSWRHHFFYYCFVCEFVLGTECAFREKGGIVWCKNELILHHPSHKDHPLMTLSRPASLLCDACGVKEEDLFYHCTPCQYGIHKHCAMLPITNTLNIHSHPLTLSFIGLPSHHRKFKSYCDVCEGLLSRLYNEFWIYYCDLCRYFVHIRCMDKKKKKIEVDFEGLDIEGLPHLPMSDKSLDLIQRFLLESNCLSCIQPEISVSSHTHTLVYSNDQFLEDDSEILCDACINPIISLSYYHCAKCRYYLHLSCANLPQQLQHHSHPHLLSLCSKTRFNDVFECHFCMGLSNGFFFHCTTEGCEFKVELECAALPIAINHAYHNHPLNLDVNHPLDVRRISFYKCRGCGYFIKKNAVFGCRHCNVYLHARFVLLAKSMRHRLDSNHPLILRFPPHSYHPKPFDCYQCETEIDPNYWLYHCEECDLSFHVECIAGEDRWRYCNMKFGQKVQIVSHPHPLKFVHQASVRSSSCHNCKNKYPDYTLECETCNFRLCKKCVKKIEPLS